MRRERVGGQRPTCHWVEEAQLPVLSLHRVGPSEQGTPWTELALAASP